MGQQRLKTSIKILFLLLLLATVVWSYFYRYEVTDRIRLISYTPSALVESLANESGMSELGRRLFYVSNPQILLEAQFDQICQFGELGLVLGCYDGRDIYILDVQEDELEPVEPVTAAHEMLHVAYSRLSGQELADLQKMIDRQRLEIDNKRIEAEIESYSNDPATDIYNELHSILGSEYENLTEEMEDYYSQFFDDRSKVLKLSAEYEEVFNELEEKIAQFDKQLNQLKQQINSLEASVASLQIQIEVQRQELEQLRGAGQIEQYNSKVPGFNSLVDSHNSKVQQIRALIVEYNDLVVKRNNNVIEQNDLIKSLDSDVEAI